MKFLQVPEIEVISNALNFDTTDCRVFGRLEAYSCKHAGNDRKLLKFIEHKYDANALDAHSLSPGPEPHLPGVDAWSLSPVSRDLIVSPFGPLSQPSSRRTLFYLIATLNASFPDYDFRQVDVTQFNKVTNFHTVTSAINTTLMNVGRGHLLRDYQFWDVLDGVIELDDCDIYGYTPDLESDPYECSLWSYNYFFFNRKQKRILYLSLHSVR
ncbi:repressor of RNA polymerase III transcription MAF1 [Thamnocephalis sphaerospora]|uniref:Repressor of RNA polymerase III transcription MAF1 n=1 Tax=Thamnocephalis sphaerospora TaxID=78915 RepID=A0A4P9XP36_9FUNG|nr:repressor of RNA polymerase III transcription MAF1 [Thamnocephalis sphaerospora]|eukprot:RKP07612.1 repressor of RNA polymerase III transcription MAF1 [Thamnocephalis sphaerospora]